MTTIQERLQMKRVPLDTWSTQEKLCLASSVVRSGDQNWMSVSRALKTLGDPNRPADWFSQKNCAAQYGCLLENVETPRRKKRASEGVTETPQESIVKKLTQQRIQELQKEMADTAKAFTKLKDEVKELMTDNITEARIRELNTALEASKRDRERNAARRAQWLKEREQRRGLLEKAWRRVEGAGGAGDTPPGGAAPLLTSLLQSPGPHLMAEFLSPSSGSSALSLLLEKPSTSITPTSEEPPMLQPISTTTHNKTVSVSKTELMKIEQIKSELQEIEQQYRGNTIPAITTTEVLTPIPPLTSVVQVPNVPVSKDPTPAEVIKTPEKLDIDDIEIKAEDVYAFSDIDLEIPPVSSIHKSLSRSYIKKDTTNIVANLEDVASPSVSDSTEVINSLLSPINMNDINQIDVPTTESPAPVPAVEQIVTSEPPSVTTDVVIKDEEEIQQPATETIEEVAMDVDEPSDTNLPDVDEKVTTAVTDEQSKKVEEEESSSDVEMNQKVADIKKDLDARKSTENLSENVSEVEKVVQEKTEEPVANEEPEKLDVSHVEPKDQTSVCETQSTDQTLTDVHTETDDDTPIEVIKEDKPGKKRDYSRKKQEKEESVNSPAELEGTLSNKSEYSDEVGSDNSQGSIDKKIQVTRFKNEASMFRSMSPSTPMDSLPGSPAPPTPPSTVPPASPAPEHDKEYRSWKKAIILALSRLNTLKYASLFLRPITDDQAPGYSQVVKKPMDLTTIRKNIDSGLIRTTKEFQHSVLLMMNNALMYNRSDHRVFAMARETLTDVHTQLNILLQAQGHATLSTPLSRQARPAYNLSRSAPPASRRKRGGGETPTPI